MKHILISILKITFEQKNKQEKKTFSPQGDDYTQDLNLLQLYNIRV